MYLGAPSRCSPCANVHCDTKQSQRSDALFLGSRPSQHLQATHGPLRTANSSGTPHVRSQKDSKRKRKLSSLRTEATPTASKTAAFPLTIAEAYYALQQPAVLNMRYSEAVKNFAAVAVTAYGCGYSEDTLRQELAQATLLPEAADRIKGIDQEDCLLCVSMVWMTVMMSKSTRRWSTAKPVSDETMQQWQGFVSLIVKGYIEKRWAWTPIDRLQMELSAVTGRNERPHIVAEWARVVHTTLEQVAPQFPSQ